DLPCAKIVDEGTKAVLTQPEVQQVVDTIGGQSGAGQPVDFMRRLGAAGSRTALHYADGYIATFVEDLLSEPLATPPRIIHLATETGGLRMLIEAHALNRGQVALQRKEAMQSGPQTIAANRQHQGFHVAVG